MMMMMTMMMMNFLAEWLMEEKCLCLISIQDHSQRFLPLQVSETLRAGFEPAPNLSLDFVE